MDGNGRWAKEKGEDRLFGHFHGVESVRNVVEGAAEIGIGYLTLYAFSTENWDRPQEGGKLVEGEQDTQGREGKGRVSLCVYMSTEKVEERTQS